MENAYCGKCEQVKPVTEFSLSNLSTRLGSNGLRHGRCRPCHAEYNAEYVKNRPRVLEPTVRFKTCARCNKLKAAAEFRQNNMSRDGLFHKCMECSQQDDARSQKMFVPEPQVAEKECYKCREVKPAREFTPHIRSKDGLNATCKSCTSAAFKAKTAALKEQREQGLLTEHVAFKVCQRCHLGQSASAFTKEASRPDGLHVYCKACRHQVHQDTKAARKQLGQTVSHKTCRACGELKAAADFVKLEVAVDGLHHSCKACHAAKAKAKLQARAARLRASDLAPVAVASKRCPDCKEVKPAECFGRASVVYSASGLQIYCKVCKSVKDRVSRERRIARQQQQQQQQQGAAHQTKAGRPAAAAAATTKPRAATSAVAAAQIAATKKRQRNSLRSSSSKGHGSSMDGGSNSSAPDAADVQLHPNKRRRQQQTAAAAAGVDKHSEGVVAAGGGGRGCDAALHEQLDVCERSSRGTGGPVSTDSPEQGDSAVGDGSGSSCGTSSSDEAAAEADMSAEGGSSSSSSESDSGSEFEPSDDSSDEDWSNQQTVAAAAATDTACRPMVRQQRRRQQQQARQPSAQLPPQQQQHQWQQQWVPRRTSAVAEASVRCNAAAGQPADHHQSGLQQQQQRQQHQWQQQWVPRRTFAVDGKSVLPAGHPVPHERPEQLASGAAADVSHQHVAAVVAAAGDGDGQLPGPQAAVRNRSIGQPDSSEQLEGLDSEAVEGISSSCRTDSSSSSSGGSSSESDSESEWSSECVSLDDSSDADGWDRCTTSAAGAAAAGRPGVRRKTIRQHQQHLQQQEQQQQQQQEQCLAAGTASGVPALLPGQLQVLGQTMTPAVASAFKTAVRQQEGKPTVQLLTDVGCRQLQRRMLSELKRYLGRFVPLQQGSAGLRSWPATLPMHPQVEPYTLPPRASNTHIGLRGRPLPSCPVLPGCSSGDATNSSSRSLAAQRGIRVRQPPPPQAQRAPHQRCQQQQQRQQHGVCAGAVIGPFNGLQAFVHEMPGIAAKPLPGWSGSTVQWKLQLEAFSLDMGDFKVPEEVCVEEADIAEAADQPLALAVCALLHGNETALINDPRPDPLTHPVLAPTDPQPNVMVVEVNVGGWAFPFAMATADIAPSEELLLDYGQEYWEGRQLELQGAPQHVGRRVRRLRRGPDGRLLPGQVDPLTRAVTG